MNADRYIFSGNVGNASELRYTPTGQAVLSFSVAVNRGWFDRDSKEWKDRTQWVKCALWGEAAERKVEHVKKGVYVVVEGVPSVNAYLDREGKAQASLEVRVDNIDIVQRAARDENSSSEPEPKSESKQEEPAF